MAETEASPAPGTDPDAVLQALEEQAAGEKATADALTADVKALTEAITELTKRRDEIVKADLAYQTANHPKAVAAVRHYAEEKRSCVEASLGDKLEAAKKLVADLAAEVDTVTHDLGEAIAAQRAAESTAAAADEALAKAVTVFTERLAQPASAAGPVGVLAKLQADLKAAMDGNDAFGAFAIDDEIIRQATRLKLPALTEYRGQLIADWTAVADAQKAARDSAKAVADQKGAVEKLTRRLEALTADRIAELRRRWAARPR